MTVIEPEALACEFPDLRTDEECGADGRLFEVTLYTGKTADHPDAVLVCPEHVAAVLAAPMRDHVSEGPNWLVTLVQDVP